jgi:hypothetical protein
VGFQAAIVRVLPQGFHDPRRPCPGENMRFFNPLAVAFAVDTVISVNRIFLSARAPAPQLEIPNVRRALPLLHRHERAILAYVVAFLTDQYEGIVLGAFVEIPNRRHIRIADIFFYDRPRSGQRMIDGTDFIEKHILVVLVEVYSLQSRIWIITGKRRQAFGARFDDI